MLYVIQVKPLHEDKTLIMLNQYVKAESEEFFVMKCMRYLRQKDATWDDVEALAFPGYIFARTDDIDSLRDRLLKIPDLTKVLGAGDEVFPIYKE